jgi:hypothetical protein
MSHVNYYLLPQYMQDGAERYIEQGIQPGDFMIAVLENDLVGAFERADDTNIIAMRRWAEWLKWECPGAAWGSRAKVNAWINMGGLQGHPQGEES